MRSLKEFLVLPPTLKKVEYHLEQKVIWTVNASLIGIRWKIVHNDDDGIEWNKLE